MRAIPKPKPKINKGAGWIVTFADLMSLLLTFFILLLSFSETDVAKYEAMARSLSVSFGVASSSPGGSIIFAEQPEIAPPPPSTKPDQKDLEEEFEDFDVSDVEMLEEPEKPVEEVVQIDPNIDQLTETLVDALAAEISSEALSVSYDTDKVVVRFSDSTSFPSGSEELKDAMYPIIEKIENVLSSCEGNVTVSGYTDNLPVNSSRFRSNWDLSAARAVSVVHQLILNNKLNANRVSAAGHAETNPLAPNDTPENRAKNRRVEISVYSPVCEETGFVF
ncbi:MAG: chemotaxis protein MotB [Oleiphilaceae bacterium]|jgi:chemotaxis protein MotB